jgi:hypothetical protein
MTIVRENHTATLLPDGTVLIAGGQGEPSSNPPVNTSAEIYDPATGAFSRTGDMTGPNESHTATLLLDGQGFTDWRVRDGFTTGYRRGLYSFYLDAYSNGWGGPI